VTDQVSELGDRAKTLTVAEVMKERPYSTLASQPVRLLRWVRATCTPHGIGWQPRQGADSILMELANLN